MDMMDKYNYIHVDTVMSYDEMASKVVELTSKGYNTSFCRVHDLDIFEIHVLKPTNSSFTLSDVLDRLKNDGYTKAQIV